METDLSLESENIAMDWWAVATEDVLLGYWIIVVLPLLVIATVEMLVESLGIIKELEV